MVFRFSKTKKWREKAERKKRRCIVSTEVICNIIVNSKDEEFLQFSENVYQKLKFITSSILKLNY